MEKHADDHPGLDGQALADQEAADFADKFIIRGVDRSLVTVGVVAVTVVYVADKRTRPREYEYFIPVEQYKYDKVAIGRHITSEHKERAERAAGGAGSRKK